jgi:hypothetical protein
MKQKSTILTAAAMGLVLLIGLGVVLTRLSDLRGIHPIKAPTGGSAVPRDRTVAKVKQVPLRGSEDEDSGGRGMFGFSEQILRMLIAAMAENEDAIRKEAVLRFKDDESYLKFLANHGNVRLLGQSAALRTVRLGFDSYGDLADLMDTLDPESMGAEANYLVSIPPPTNTPESPGAGDGAVPFGQSALEWLGVTGDNSTWGQGVKVAVLDSGVQSHSVFGEKSIREWNYVFDAEGNVLPVDPNAGHGTAVASIIGGEDSRLPGVAPQSELLSFRILDNQGYTNSFTLAEAIVAAADQGASLINVSLGSSGDSLVVRDAVDYAMGKGALIIASSGNEGAGQVSYPAAIEDVIAVGAVDARGEHLDFSNAGTGLYEGGIAAPGLGLLAAWPEEKAFDFSGTSASTPYVAGAIAAVMSENEGMGAQAAYDLLVTHANEAGAPGPDPEYGVGNLNIGRALEAGTPGIIDVAVASYHYDPMPGVGGNANAAQVIVENRGTEPVHNVNVLIDSGDGERSYNVAFLQPGETQVIPTPINASAASAAGGLGVAATASLNTAFGSEDRDLSDNTFQRVIDISGGE